MHIIFGDQVKDISDRYTVLELDTFHYVKEDRIATAYCVVDEVGLEEFPLLEAHKKIHADLIKAYKKRHWKYCEDAIEGLMGKWRGELDTFYTDLLGRVQKHKVEPPSKTWTGMRVKL